MRLISLFHWLAAAIFAMLSIAAYALPDMAFIDNHIAAHPQQSGVYVLDKGEEALLARAWLADHAQKTIEVQYFIWSTDNIGILAYWHQKPYCALRIGA
ncbi:MAG: hypothetical protein ABL880_11685 [Methylotenera sp.]